MITLWFVTLCSMLTFFIILDGWDFGAGALHFVVARTPEERRELIAAIGPLWSWHEVWLVGSGGILFVAFPRVLSMAFPAYYLALYLVLWSLLLRGLSIEFRGHIFSPLWHAFWDGVFCLANVLLAVLFGTAIGNVMRGMPLLPNSALTLPLFTQFGVRRQVGILDWYTLSFAVFALVCLAAHGASYLATRTEGRVYVRSRRISGILWMATAALLVVITLETADVRPELFSGMRDRPLAWIPLAITATGLLGVYSGLRSGKDHRAFFGGCAVIAGLLGTAAASLFPVMLHSTISPEYSITAWNGASSPASLQAAMYWWPVSFVLAIVYFIFIGKHYGGRVQPSQDTQHPY
jgi:cytochrome bd ubiquinol oxidase subunit II